MAATRRDELAHHEVPGTGTRSPVHAAGVVAHFVGAYREELAVGARAPRRVGVVGRESAAGAEAGRGDREHPGPDEHGLGRRDLAPASGQPQRVEARGGGGPQGERAPVVGGEAVGGCGHGPGVQRREEEPGPQPIEVDRLGQVDQCRRPRGRHREVDPRGVAHVQARGFDPAGDGDRGAGERDPGRGPREDPECGETEHAELVRAEDAPAREQAHRGPGDGPPAPGEPERALRHPPARGTGTRASTSRTMSPWVTPCSSASGLRMSRCSSTAGASQRTSSGMV